MSWFGEALSVAGGAHDICCTKNGAVWLNITVVLQNPWKFLGACTVQYLVLSQYTTQCSFRLAR